MVSALAASREDLSGQAHDRQFPLDAKSYAGALFAGSMRHRCAGQQTAGYLPLDCSDTCGINHTGLYLSRPGIPIAWPVLSFSTPSALTHRSPNDAPSPSGEALAAVADGVEDAESQGSRKAASRGPGRMGQPSRQGAARAVGAAPIAHQLCSSHVPNRQPHGLVRGESFGDAPRPVSRLILGTAFPARRRPRRSSVSASMVVSAHCVLAVAMMRPDAPTAAHPSMSLLASFRRWPGLLPRESLLLASPSHSSSVMARAKSSPSCL